MTVPFDSAIFVLVCSSVASQQQLLEAMLTDLLPGQKLFFHHAETPAELQDWLTEGGPYRLILVAPAWADWLTPQLQAELLAHSPGAELIVMGEAAVTATRRVPLPAPSSAEAITEGWRAGLQVALAAQLHAAENRQLLAELNNLQLELQIARRRVDELTALQDPTDQQAIYQLLLARIRHEVNNPLTGVLGQAQLLLRRGEHLPEESRRRLETIEKLTLRISEVFKNFEEAIFYEPQLAPSPAYTVPQSRG